jgi:hypothetical protein
MQRPNRRRVPLAVLALAAPLMLSSSTTGSGRGDEASASGSAGVCEAADPGAMAQRIADELARVKRPENMPPADKDLVVLNGRGYNYGAADPEPLDRIQLEALMAEIENTQR